MKRPVYYQGDIVKYKSLYILESVWRQTDFNIYKRMYFTFI